MQTILFLHGWGGNDKSFAPIEPFLRANYNCIFLSMPCFQVGDDNVPQIPWTLEDYRDFVLAELDKHKVDECYIIAHSFGARIAVLLAESQPSRFVKLILTGPAGIPRRFNLCLWLKILLHKLKIKRSKGSIEYQALTDAGKITFQNIIKRDLRPEIARIGIPTLIIWGSRDRAVRQHMVKSWTKLSQDARLIIYKNSGHFCFLDAPARFIIDTQEFLNV